MFPLHPLHATKWCVFVWIWTENEPCLTWYIILCCTGPESGGTCSSFNIQCSQYRRYFHSRRSHSHALFCETMLSKSVLLRNTSAVIQYLSLSRLLPDLVPKCLQRETCGAASLALLFVVRFTCSLNHRKGYPAQEIPPFPLFPPSFCCRFAWCLSSCVTHVVVLKSLLKHFCSEWSAVVTVWGWLARVVKVITRGFR